MRMDDYLISVGNSFLTNVVREPGLSVSILINSKNDDRYFVLTRKPNDELGKASNSRQSLGKVIGKYISMDDLIVSNFPDLEEAWMKYFSERF